MIKRIICLFMNHDWIYKITAAGIVRKCKVCGKKQGGFIRQKWS